MIKPVNYGTLVGTLRQQLLEIINEQHRQEILRLPPEQDMALQFNVARNTLRQVLFQLEAEGLITRKHGQGTFINPEALQIKVNLQELIDFSDIVRRCGHVPSHTIHSLAETKANSDLSAKLKVPKEHHLLRVEYWIYADGQPAIVVAGWCPFDSFAKPPELSDWEEHSCFNVLYEKAGKLIKSDRILLQAITRQKMEDILGHKTCLTCPSVLNMDSVGFDQHGLPMIFGSAYFDTSLIEFDLFRTIKE